jgi:parvulin-like peptidyl-prolyl isomerase
MKNRQPENRLRDRIEQLRARRRGQTTPSAPVRRRRISRREREARQRRMLYWGIGVAGGLVLLILAGFALNQYVVTPRHVLATVDGTKIRREDYWKVRSLDLINQASQYQQFSMFAQDANQQQQYRALAQQALAELPTVWGSKSVDDATLSRMIENQIYLKGMKDLGLSVSQADVDNFILQQFEPANAPIFTPTPSPTLIPQRAAWATETAVASESPTPAASPVASPAGATPVGATPSASPVASPGASPITGASPAATPVGSPAATPSLSPTPSQAEAIQTAEAGYKQYRDQVFSETHMSRGDYERLVAKPAVARQKVKDAIDAQIGQTAEQVHAAHILVSTEDLANKIYQQVTAPGASFEEIAKQQSTDTATAPNGGDLGWFTHGTMVDQFDKVAFSLKPGEISKPFKTQFGWHIVKVYAHEQERALTDEQISRLEQAKIQDWLDQERSELDVSSELKPTPTQASEEFVPPPDAPPPPTPTAPGASPVAGSPAASPLSGTPVASPVASPQP